MSETVDREQRDRSKTRKHVSPDTVTEFMQIYLVYLGMPFSSSTTCLLRTS